MVETVIAKVGDRLIYCYPHRNGIEKALEIVEVVKVFPSGMLDAKNSKGEILRFNPDWSRRGIPRMERFVRYLRDLRPGETWEDVEEKVRTQYDPPPPPDPETIREIREALAIRWSTPGSKRR